MFQLEHDHISLMPAPFFKKLDLPVGKDSKFGFNDEPKFNAIVNLMNIAHMDENNAGIFVVQNLDKPYYSLKWLYDKLPQQVQVKFSSHREVRGFLSRFKDTFLVLGTHVQLRQKLQKLPCEKTISLEILKILKATAASNGMSMRDIFNQLPGYCSDRIRSVGELQKFFTLHSEFHVNSADQVAKQTTTTPRESNHHRCQNGLATPPPNSKHELSLIDSAIMSCGPTTASVDEDFLFMAPADSLDDGEFVIDI